LTSVLTETQNVGCAVALSFVISSHGVALLSGLQWICHSVYRLQNSTAW